VTIPKYLEAFRRVARESRTREKSEVSEKRGEGGGLISLNSLISHPEASQNPSESEAAGCAVCRAGEDLWHLDTAVGTVPVHQECAEFLPRPEPAEPTAAYRGVSAGPDGTSCEVEIVELPQAARYRKVFGVLQLRPPAHIPEDRWRQAISDGRAFLRQWGQQAQALNWSSADLFGLIEIPEHPSPSFNRLSRYERLGLCWLLHGKTVIALTADTATIRNPTTGNVTVYRKQHKPALGPLGDSLEDFV
jgi:hypothetical protein